MKGGELRSFKRLRRLNSGIKQRIHRPKLPKDSCYAGVGYGLPIRPYDAAHLIMQRLGPIPDGLSLDRIDPNGDYHIDNLRYATPAEQTANRRTPIRYEDDD